MWRIALAIPETVFKWLILQVLQQFQYRKSNDLQLFEIKIIVKKSKPAQKKKIFYYTSFFRFYVNSFRTDMIFYISLFCLEFIKVYYLEKISQSVCHRTEKQSLRWWNDVWKLISIKLLICRWPFLLEIIVLWSLNLVSWKESKAFVQFVMYFTWHY